MNASEQTTPAKVAERSKQAGEALGQRWSWVEASVWTERMLEALERGDKGESFARHGRFSLHGSSFGGQPVSRIRPHQLESRMREIRQSGSGGGVASSIATPTSSRNYNTGRLPPHPHAAEATQRVPHFPPPLHSLGSPCVAVPATLLTSSPSGPDNLKT